MDWGRWLSATWGRKTLPPGFRMPFEEQPDAKGTWQPLTRQHWLCFVDFHLVSEKLAFGFFYRSSPANLHVSGEFAV